MDDFSAPHVTNEFGLLPCTCQLYQAREETQSSAVPRLVLDKKGNVLMTIGAAGGTIITTSVAQVNASDISHGVVQGIVKNPHKFKKLDTHGKRKGYVYSLMPQIYAESDYRKGGLPAGY
ncbi:hypothetical protein OS493_000979 [Desmophyllum pertusum]|uniref:Uncharacterized protein n=1 Tax=Desmophyllum pertusum TaxID=174260 RepID=A0A9X0D6Q8_9CNID|nr:hypothetical protein OS493_000979 [Desmophyllum pertusum]